MPIDGVAPAALTAAIRQSFIAVNPNGMLWHDTCRGGSDCSSSCPLAVAAGQRTGALDGYGMVWYGMVWYGRCL